MRKEGRRMGWGDGGYSMSWRKRKREKGGEWDRCNWRKDLRLDEGWG